MTPKEQREQERQARAQGREQRLEAARERQRAADVETYGEGSMLLEAQQGKVGGINEKGGVFDVSTTDFRVPDNTPGKNSNITETGVHSIPRIPALADAAGGDDDEFDLVTFDVVLDDNTAGQYQWRAEEVT